MKIKQKKNIVLRKEFDNYYLLYDPDTGNTHPVNATGAFFWQQINENNDNEISLDDIIKNMQNKFDKVSTNIKSDLKNFIDQLKKIDYIK